MKYIRCHLTSDNQYVKTSETYNAKTPESAAKKAYRNNKHLEYIFLYSIFEKKIYNFIMKDFHF